MVEPRLPVLQWWSPDYRRSYLRLPSSRSCCVTMAAVSTITAAVEKLNGQNYRSWKYNIKMLLIEKGL
ncbi:hypothetical protein LAZ67_10001008 [Cordylochernes scorpioides]|uniref:Retrotransposon Copia-like N-terminal domain-containing protein n=1 Tax=Cordylochernes scorpioides TaxID=51811 RepID=A0ABY6KXL0_9ARAC|nr:hypothetical protein LAZ67_10001008 [Cordylochernes scorpioides]